MLWLFLLALLRLVASQDSSGPYLVYGLQDQRPPIARVNQTWSWTLLNGTFDSSSEDVLVYTASGLPGWAAFNAQTLTFSGLPTENDVGEDNVNVQAATAANPGATASGSFQLLVSSEPPPTIKYPILQQLLNGTTGEPAGCVLDYDGSLRIPPYWSFSIGLQWDTFALPGDIDFAFYTAYLVGTTSLPDWLQFSTQTVTFNGVTPAGGIYNIIVFGSSRYGYGDVSQTFSITVSDHAFDLTEPLPVLNTTLGATVEYVVPTVNLTIDHVPATPSNITYITVDLTRAPFLSFSEQTHVISGQVPLNFDQVNSTLLPVTFNNTYGQALTTFLDFIVVGAASAASGASLLSNESIPAVMVVAGQSFSDDLSQYAISSLAQYSIEVQPSAASNWVSFNASDRTLSGTAPNPAPNYGNVSVTLIAQASANSAIETTSFALDITPSTGQLADATKSSSGLSKSAKLALGILFGLIGAILLALLLYWCWRRRRESRSDVVEDQRTLKGDMSPYPMTHSPLPDPLFTPVTPVTPYNEKPKIFAGMFKKRQPAAEAEVNEKSDEPRRFGLLSVVAPHHPPPNGLGIESPDNSFDVQMGVHQGTYRSHSAESVADSFVSGHDSTSTSSMLYTPDKPSSEPRRWIPSRYIVPPGARAEAASSQVSLNHALPPAPADEDETAIQVPSPAPVLAIATATRHKVDYGNAQLREVIGRRDVQRQTMTRHEHARSRHLEHVDVDAAMAEAGANPRDSILSEPYVPRHGTPVTSAVFYSPDPSEAGHSPKQPNEWGNLRMVANPTPADARRVFAPDSRPSTPEPRHKNTVSDELGSGAMASVKHEPQIVTVKTGGVLKFVPILVPRPIVTLGSPTRSAPARTGYSAYIVNPDDPEQARQPLPKWLSWNEGNLEFWGIPKEADIGELHIQIISRKAKEPSSPHRRDTFNTSSTQSEPEEERLVARVTIQIIRRPSRVPTVVQY